MKEGLIESKLTFEAIESFSTPRRLVLAVTGLPEKTLSKSEEKRGPSVLAPKNAIEGFSKSMNVNISDLFTKIEKKGEFYYAKLEKRSQTSANIIPEIIINITKNSMEKVNEVGLWKFQMGQTFTLGCLPAF